MRKILFGLLALGLLPAMAEPQPFSRYQSILDRLMFGPLPPGFDPSKTPLEVAKSKAGKELTQEQQKLKSAVHFSVINVRPDGKVEVGFTDSSDPKTPHHYFICEGKTAGGWKVESANPQTAEITLINRDGIQLDLTLGDNSATGGGKAQAVGAQGGGTASAATHGGALTFRSRRERIAAEREATLERERQDRLKQAEADKAERDELRQTLHSLVAETKLSREAENKELEKAKAELEKVKAEAEKAKAEAEKARAEAESAKEESERAQETKHEDDADKS